MGTKWFGFIETKPLDWHPYSQHFLEPGSVGDFGPGWKDLNTGVSITSFFVQMVCKHLAVTNLPAFCV